MTSGDLFLPDGFRYRDDAISEGEARALVARFAALPLKPFEFHGYLGKRRVVSYGYRYDYAGRRLRDSAVLPDFLEPLRAAAMAFSGVPSLDQALVTEYAAGAGIGWHRDKPMFGSVVAFSFLSECTLRFRRKQGARWERRKTILKARSAYVLSGEARWDWEHSIPEMEALRYSVTFRDLLKPLDV